MTRYVEKKHGLVIGSGNWFFWFGTEENKCVGDYRAVVWAKQLDFKQVNVANYFIRSPAHQLIWKHYNEVRTQKVDDEEWDANVEVYKPNDYVRVWLDTFAPGWACPPPESNQQQPTLFFTKRSHALAFTRFVEQQLEGMDYL